MPNQPVSPFPSLASQRLSTEDVERALLAEVSRCESQRHAALWALAKFYQTTGRLTLAAPTIHRILTSTDYPETKACCCLALGQIMEGLQDFEAARAYYYQALALEPADQDTWYFINNNLGYCLNQLDRFAEAEGYCQRAITSNPARHNAHKNLGLALAGQGRIVEAARALLAAIHANPRDSRALQHLGELVQAHARAFENDPDLLADIQACGLRVPPPESPVSDLRGV